MHCRLACPRGTEVQNRSETSAPPRRSGLRPRTLASSAATPAEGADLIRAFLRIESADVRAALVELAVRLADSTRQ